MDVEDLGKRVAAARAYAGISSQQKLADMLGTSQSTVQRIEAGDRSLRPHEQVMLLKAIAYYCDLPYEWFTADLGRLAEISEPDLMASVDPQAAAALLGQGLEAAALAKRQGRASSKPKARGKGRRP